MKKIAKKLILTSAFLIFNMGAANADYVSKGKIVEIRVNERGSVDIVRESNPNQDECSNANSFFMGRVHEERMPMFAAILSAYQADKEVTFKTNSCGGEGYINRIQGVMLE